MLAGAARTIAAVAFEGRSFEDAFARCRGRRRAARGPARGAARSGSRRLRWYLQLEPLVERLAPGKVRSTLLRALLVAALHQLEYSRNPIETSVSSAVDAARLLGQARAAGMVNALLRRYLRERDAIRAPVLAQRQAASAHPLWLLDRLQAVLSAALAADRRGEQRPSADDAAGGSDAHDARGLPRSACSSTT